MKQDKKQIVKLTESEIKNIVSESVKEVLNKYYNTINEEITSFNSMPYRNHQGSGNKVTDMNKVAIRYESVYGDLVTVYHYGRVEVYGNNGEQIMQQKAAFPNVKDCRKFKANEETSKNIAKWWSQRVNPQRTEFYELGCDWRHWAGLV